MSQAKRKETQSVHPNGSIVRITCHNFLTYRDVTIHPGPRLNVVVGPNGSGKSSIVCAIAIALGAHPKLLGRSDKVEEFIMQGEVECWVELEIFCEDRVNDVIRRTLSNNENDRNRNAFHWNKIKKTQAQIKVLVESTGAQLSNLCTFLPQEKVGEFSGFNSIELLREAERAISETILYDRHEELIKSEGEIDDLERQLSSKKVHLESLKKQNQDLEKDREKMEQRQQHLIKAELCTKRLHWIAFDESQAEAIRLKKEKEDTQKELEAAKQRFDPLKEKEREALTATRKLTNEIDQLKKNIDVLSKKNKSTIEKAGRELENMNGHKEQIVNLKSTERDHQQKVKSVENKIDEAKAKLEHHKTSCNGIKEIVKNLKSELAIATNESSSASTYKDELSQAVRIARSRQEKVERELGSLGDGQKEQRDALRYANRDSLKLLDWITRPENRGRFKRTVHGPVAMSLAINRPEFLDVVEEQIPYRVLTGFVTECNEDYQVLLEMVKHSKFKITIYNIEGGKLKNRRPLPAQDWVNQNLITCLEDIVSCPDAVKQVLRDHAQLDTAVVGLDEFSNMMNQDSKGTVATLTGNTKGFIAYAGNRGKYTKYRGNKSKYQAGEFSTSVNSVKPSRIIKKGEDPSIRTNLQKKVEMARVDVEKAQKNYDSQSVNYAKLRKQRDDLIKKIEKNQTSLKAGAKYEKEIASLQKKHEAMLNDQKSFDPVKDRKVLIKKMSISMQKRLDLLEQANGEANTILSDEFKKGGVSLSLEITKDIHALRLRELKAEEEGVKDKDRKLQEIKGLFAKCKENLKQVRSTAENEAPLFESDGNGNRTALPLKALLDALPLDRPTVTAQKEAAESAAALLHHNPRVIEQYNARKQEIQKIEDEIALMEKDGQSPLEKFDKMKNAWRSKLTEHCRELNKLFSAYMRECGNVGKVELYESTESLSKWGLILSVSFRKDGTPVPLKKSVQSGGERSVSTIMFLMALQDMVKSPFRVVDEINQGMDERNERIVFRRIVERSVGPNRPQYFLITPKLLQGLTAMEHDDVTVLFVFNGPYNLQKTEQWDLKKFLTGEASSSSASSSSSSSQIAKRRKVQ